MSRIIFALCLALCSATLSAQATNFPVVMTTDWSIIFNGQMPANSATSGAITPPNFATCTVSTDLSTATATAAGTAPFAPAAAPLVSSIAGRQIQALHNFGTGTARVRASATTSSFRVEFGGGAGTASSTAAFTTTVPGGNVTGSINMTFGMPTVSTVPSGVDVTQTGTGFFQYQTLQNASAALSLFLGGGARWNATAQVTAVGYLN